MLSDDIKWYRTMSTKALLLLVMLLALMGVAIAYVLNTTGESMVRDSANRRVEAQVESAAQSLGQLSTNVETIAFTIADTLELSQSPEKIAQTLTTLMQNHNIKDIVASGGFWPEPFRYDDSQGRSSIFVAFDGQGEVEVIDDYNAPSARPYQQEEWYVPVRWSEYGQSYWSRAYTDPYTGEPMVTCSVPFFDKGKFSGVVTIDIRLTKLHNFLTRSGEKIGGYLTLLDRSGRFMSYPDQKLVQSKEDGQISLMMSGEKANLESKFIETALLISEALQRDRLELQRDVSIHSLAKAIVSNSSDIDFGYALSVASELQLSTKQFRHTQKLFDHKIQNDPVLNEPTYVFGRSLPDTHWLLIGALPERLLLDESTELKSNLFYAVSSVSLLLVLVTFSAIHFGMVRPLARVRTALVKQTNKHELGPIDYQQHDEIGMLVSEFNRLCANLVDTRERAIAAARAKQLFLANISHEIRTPMNGILGATSLMQDEPMSHKQAEYLSVINHSSRGLMSLINNILDFSKMESNHLKLEEEPFDLQQLGKYVRDLLLPTIQNKEHLVFDYVYDPKCPKRFVGDAHRIEQVMLNLVSNALKFTGSGLVSLKISPQYDAGVFRAVCIDVSDTGVGIPEDKLSAVFDEFQQADTSTTRKFGGSGLGLAISKQLVELMGGEIKVISKLQKGSIFSVYLPLSIEYGSIDQQDNDTPEQKGMSFNDKCCLLVEDNAINMMVAEKMLLKQGFDVDKANDGLLALEKMDVKKYDLIFMDIQMPRMDGLEATRHIRTGKSMNSLTPIVAMTANVMKEDIWRCISSGMQGHIGKPLRENEIFAVTRKALGSKVEVEN